MKNKILFSFIVLAGMAISSAMAQVLPRKQETLKTLTLVNSYFMKKYADYTLPLKQTEYAPVIYGPEECITKD